MNIFTLGDTVMFDPSNLNQDYWNGLTNKQKSEYYGNYGWGYLNSIGERKLKLFTFITHHYPQLGHCLLMDMDTGKLLPMCHTRDFRLVSDEEC